MKMMRDVSLHSGLTLAAMVLEHRASDNPVVLWVAKSAPNWQGEQPGTIYLISVLYFPYP